MNARTQCSPCRAPKGSRGASLSLSRGRSSPVPAQAQRSAEPGVSTAWVQRQIGKAVDGMTAAMGRFVGQQLNAMRLRVVESERRIAELEAKIEELNR